MVATFVTEVKYGSKISLSTIYVETLSVLWKHLITYVIPLNSLRTF